MTFVKFSVISMVSSVSINSEESTWLLLCFTFVTFLLFTEPSGLISSASAPVCAFLIIFFQAISVIAILRRWSDIPICLCSYVLTLLGKVFYIKFVLNFKSNETHFSSCSSLTNLFSVFPVYQFSLQFCWQRLPSWSQGHQDQFFLLHDIFSMMTLAPKETLVLNITF